MNRNSVKSLPKWVQEEFARLDNTINRQCRQYNDVIKESKLAALKIRELEDEIAAWHARFTEAENTIDSLSEQIEQLEINSND